MDPSAGPQVVRAADLAFALSDMDAQAANLLLVGADPDCTVLRRQTLDTYEQRRAQATGDLQRAAEAAVGDPAGQLAVQTVPAELGRYEVLVARAQLLAEQAGSPAAKPSPPALEAYRQATDLLRQKLLPAAEQVTAANAVTVERIHADARARLSAITESYALLLATTRWCSARVVRLRPGASVRTVSRALRCLAATAALALATALMHAEDPEPVERTLVGPVAVCRQVAHAVQLLEHET